MKNNNEDVNGNDFTTDAANGSSKSPQQWVSKYMSKVAGPKSWLKRVPIVEWLPKYSVQDLTGDAVAGVTVALTVIPQGLALAGVAKLPPQYGLYTAFMGSFVYIIFGSAKDLTIGPTAIMCIMTGQYTSFGGPTYAILLSLICGFIQLVMGLLNLGFIVDFISGSVITGFTTAGALTIASTQLKDLTGIKIKAEHFFDALYQFFAGIRTMNLADTSLGVLSIVILLLLRAFKAARLSEDKSALPPTFIKLFNGIWVTLVTARNVIVVLACGTLAAVLEARNCNPFTLTGTVQGGLPEFRVPSFTYTYNDTTTGVPATKSFPDILGDLHMGIAVISLLSILESMAIAKAFAKGKHVDATQEMFALGMCNIIGSFVQAFPATGSFSRTAINNSSGVRTTMGGLFTGLTVIAALAFLSPYFFFIPKATLAAIIITSVIFMIHYEDVILMWETSRSDLVPYFCTVFASFILGLEYGIILGILIAIFSLLHHNARPKITLNSSIAGQTRILVCEIDRSILFPSALFVTGKIGEKIREELAQHDDHKQTLILIDGSHLPNIDFTTCLALKGLQDELENKDRILAFTKLSASAVNSISASLGKKFRHFSSTKDCQAFIQDLNNVPEIIERR